MNDRIRMMFKAINMYQRRGWKWTNGMFQNRWKSKRIQCEGYTCVVVSKYIG